MHARLRPNVEQLQWLVCPCSLAAPDAGVVAERHRVDAFAGQGCAAAGRDRAADLAGVTFLCQSGAGLFFMGDAA